MIVPKNTLLFPGKSSVFFSTPTEAGDGEAHRPQLGWFHQCHFHLHLEHHCHHIHHLKVIVIVIGRPIVHSSLGFIIFNVIASLGIIGLITNVINIVITFTTLKFLIKCQHRRFAPITKILKQH